MTKISELSALLTKVQSTAGDVEIILKDAASEVETVITDLEIHLDPVSGSTGGSLTLVHALAGVVSPPTPADETLNSTE